MDNLNNQYVPVRERIFTLLASKHISQKDFAKEIGVHAVVTTDWKKGKNFSFMKKLGPIAEALGTTEIWLLTGREEVTPETVREMEAIAEAANVHLLDLLGVGGKLSQYRIDFSNFRSEDGKERTPEDRERAKGALSPGVRQVYDEVSPEDRAKFLGMLTAGKKMTAPEDGGGIQMPAGYEQLNPANRAIVDRLIADLAKSQSDG